MMPGVRMDVPDGVPRSGFCLVCRGTTQSLWGYAGGGESVGDGGGGVVEIDGDVVVVAEATVEADTANGSVPTADPQQTVCRIVALTRT